MEDGADPRDTAPFDGDPGRQPLSVRLLGAGVRGARSVGKATGVDRAVESAAEDAMVAAVESEAVERALLRVLQGPLVEEATRGALESESVKRAMVDALDSETVDEVWRRMLASQEAQRLVERIAEAPEIRAAISAQSVGFIEDIGHTIGEGTREADGVVERVARRVAFRRRRAEPTERAGAVTRALALGLDALVVNLGFSGLAAVLALIGSFFSGDGGNVTGFALALGGAAWLWLGALYLVALWSLAGQTLGMRFFGIRLGVEGGLPLRRSVRRLVGMGLGALCLGIGFLGIVFDPRRRAWSDRLSGVDVLYESREEASAPWSRLDPVAPGAGGEALGDRGEAAGAGESPAAEKAPESSRGLRPQGV